ncbi:MAG: SGNH/GDSL hydrolase family protein [Bacteroidetes bacterium]|nr:SGNH/GDSL hydrolase family protein [Bacteroidota bacterium]
MVRPTVSGTALRIKLENTLGQAAVTFGAVFVGVSGPGASIEPDTNVRLTFLGDSSLTLDPGAGIWSDSVTFSVKAFQQLTVSMSVAAASDISTHSLGLATNYFAPGDRAAETSGTGYIPVPAVAGGTKVQAFPSYWISSVDVWSSLTVGTIVPFGDSITDGRCSTTENGIVIPDRYQRWTDVLAERLNADPNVGTWAVANAAIAGNRIISGGNGPPGLERLDRDVLERAGATHVIFFEGTNDIGNGATADQIIQASQMIIDRVHAKGIRIIGATMIPRGGPTGTGWNTTMEEHRRTVNAWIRTSGAFDGVIDFDQLMKGGPIHDGSESIRPEFDCDFTHPNAAGYKAMGEFVDLSLFLGVRGIQK